MALPEFERGAPPLTSKHPLDDIQRVAAKMMSRQGFASASMQTLADELGLVKATLYYHVLSKENLLYRVVSSIVDERIRRWSKVLAQPASAAGRLELLVEQHLAMVEHHQDELIVLSDELGHLSQHHLDYVRGRLAVADGLIREIIAAGDSAGEFDVSDPAAAATVVLAILDSMVRWYQPGGKMKNAEFARETTALILSGVCSRSNEVPAAP